MEIIKEIISKLKNIFAIFGILNQISDNVPFNSYKFKNFAKEYDFDNVFMTPRHFQSNGLAEKGVQIVKMLIKKSFEDKSNVIDKILEYRETRQC